MSEEPDLSTWLIELLCWSTMFFTGYGIVSLAQDLFSLMQ